MAVFRVEKTKNFTVMSNHHLRNSKLSLKAKGLMSLMLSLPEDWDYTLKGLTFICKDGEDSVATALQELEREGYLTRQRLRLSNGRLGSIEYTIHEQPKKLDIEPNPPKLENPEQVFPEQAFPEQAFPEQDSPEQLLKNFHYLGCCKHRFREVRTAVNDSVAYCFYFGGRFDTTDLSVKQGFNNQLSCSGMIGKIHILNIFALSVCFMDYARSANSYTLAISFCHYALAFGIKKLILKRA